MAIELDKAYDPKAAQQRFLSLWEEKGYFHSDPDPAKKPYTIVIPPPNVTGALHMGHALNNTLQDVLIRWRRMQGYNALWMPGTDHAGIATQAVVERLVMQTEKKTRHDLGREELVKRIWQWKDKYEARILGQLREMGASCDWRRTRFTLDPQCARAVRETFFRMFKDGYIYRGKRLVNWDAQLQTSVADDETYTEDTKGGFWTFKYAVVGMPDTFVRFSTTRPETMLGDTALCVHPSDERYKHLIGKKVLQPLVNREIPIIADGQLADPELGTGCVKVTPAHDPNDYACWQRHPEIGIINILNPDGTINEQGGSYAGMPREKAREATAKAMEDLGLYEGKEDRVIPLKYSDRSKTPIEPYLSDQWFVRMADREDGMPGLAQMTMDTVTSGRVKFFPERYAKSYLDWLGEKRDWCISRQLWWGHQIPVWQFRLNAGMYQQESGGSIRASRNRVEEEFRDALMEFAKAASIQKDIAIAEAEDKTILYVCARTEQAGIELRSFVHRRQAPFLHPMAREPVPFLNEDDPRRQPEAKLAELLNTSEWMGQNSLELKGQDPSVLDTWFSSALWPHSTLGWPGPTLPEERSDRVAADWDSLRYYYPTSTLVTSRDIITLWVARMVLTGLYNLNDIPFDHVYITPKVLDGFGEGMSKSKGNGVDPLDIIDLYGADAMRYYVVSIAGEMQDTRLPVANVCPHCGTLVAQKKEHQSMRTRKLVCPGDKAKGIVCDKPFRPSGPWTEDDPELPTARAASDRFELGRNFANKLWNATRFLLMNLEGYTPAALNLPELPTEDRWIVSRLATTARAVTEALEGYKFAEVARLVYEFTWSEFCDWYIEMSKGRLKDTGARPQAQRVLAGVLDGILRLVQPVMPFVAEALWQALNEAAPERGLPTPVKAEESVVIAKWPTYPEGLADEGIENAIARMQDLVRGVREIRNRYQVEPKTRLELFVKCSQAVAMDFTQLAPFIGPLAGLSGFEAGPAVTKPKQSGSIVRADFEAYVPLAGLIDNATEAKKVEKEIGEKRKQLDGANAKLGNANFVAKAPPEQVQEVRDKVAELEGQLKVLEVNLKDLQGE